MGPSPALDGPLWHANGPLARVLAATIPSGDPVIVDLRMEIGSIIGLTVPDVFLPVEWETPVLNFDDLDRPWPASSIYVGHGPHGCGMNPSPWGSPYASASMAETCPYDERFVLYAEARADVVYWLRPLVGKKLICHCSQKCHATQLVALIGKHFKHGELYRSSQPPFGLHEASCSVAPSDVAPVDPINGGSGDPMIAPYPGGSWPDEWRALVENIRGAPYGMAWEIFSGCQSISRALADLGWTCAPPVDISYSNWFNVLNPVFASIIVGIILEGRITLLVLDPPEGGPPHLCQAIRAVAVSFSKAMFRTGGHVLWCGDGSEQTELCNHICVSSCNFGTPWCQRMVFSSTWSGILDIGALCKDRCGLVQRSNNIEVWPLLADSISKCVNGILGVIINPKCAHLAGFCAPMGATSMVSCLELPVMLCSWLRCVRTISAPVMLCSRMLPTLPVMLCSWSWCMYNVVNRWN